MLAYSGNAKYLFTAYEVNSACAQLLRHPPTALGWDIEWMVTYKTGQQPRPVALIQLCFAAATAAPAPPAYSCLLLHVARSGITHHLKELLCCEGLLKVGVGAHGDALKMERDFSLTMRGVVDLSEYANARLCGGDEGSCAPQKWSLTSLSERLLRHTVDKRQELRCSDWESPLSASQRSYAATDACASLRLYEVLSAMLPTWRAPGPPPVPAAGEATGAGSWPGAQAGEEEEAVPACAQLGLLQPAKLAVFELHRQGWSFVQIAAHRRLKEDTVQAYLAEGIVAGQAYSWRRFGISPEVLGGVAQVAGSLLGRQLRCSVPSVPGGGDVAVDVLAALLAARGDGIRELKEGSFPALGYGQLRLALAHLGRCNPGPWT